LFLKAIFFLLRFDPEIQEICMWIGSALQARQSPRPVDPDLYVQDRDLVDLFVRFAIFTLSRKAVETDKKINENYNVT
jgi:hypothetical protein